MDIFLLCCEREILFSFFSARELLSACVLAVFLFFNIFLCICVFVLYHLVVRAASVDGCLCLSGSLPLIFFCMLVLISRRINMMMMMDHLFWKRTFGDNWCGWMPFVSSM